MSKQITMNALLVGVLLLSSMACVALGLRYSMALVYADRLVVYARQIEARAAVMNRSRALVNAVFNEATEYSKKSPAMAALLQQHKAQFEQLNARSRAAAAPSTNPPGR